MKIINSILIQRHVHNVLYIQKVAELVRLVTGLQTASPVSSPASCPDVQHFDTSPSMEDAKERRRETERERRKVGNRASIA